MSQAARPSGQVLLTGGSGMVGQALASALEQAGRQPLFATREGSRESSSAALPGGTLPWNPQSEHPFADPARLEEIDLAIHLSGANLAAKRWTPAYKREIVSSRTVTTAALARTLAALRRPPRMLIVASATGIYGDRGDELLTEASAPGTGFLSETCQAWEQASGAAAAAGICVVHLRLGVVLDPRGGALAKVLPLFRVGLGGRLGSGRQWMSWIAIDDLVRAVIHIAGYGVIACYGVESKTKAAIGSDGGIAAPARAGASPAGDQASSARQALPRTDFGHQLEGAVNCVTPGPVTNQEYTRALASVLHRPAFAMAPGFALRMAMGEMADQALLSSCRAVPEKLLANGFQFRYPTIEPALAHLLDR